MRKIKNLKKVIVNVFGEEEFLDIERKKPLSIYYAIIGALNVRHDGMSDEENLSNGFLVNKLIMNNGSDEIEVSLDELSIINKAVKRIYNPYITTQLINIISAE